MRLTFMGQQSWAVELDKTFVLIDPVLPTWFGTSARQRFEVWPPRRILIQRMPDVSTVIITNEHLDHFNLRSLLMLPKSTKVYMGELTPAVCVEAVEKAGLSIQLLRDREPLVIDDLIIQLYQCAPESAPWEKRVYHAVVSSASRAQSIVIQSDGLLSHDLKSDFSCGVIPPMAFFVATNNAQVVPPGASSTYDNLLPLGEPSNEGPFGLHIFNEVLCRTLDDLPYVPHIAFCGGGYVQVPAKHGPFLLGDTEELKSSFAALSLGQTVHCPRPGNSYLIDTQGDEPSVRLSQVDWIELIEVSGPGLPSSSDWFSEPIFSALETPSAHQAAIELVEREFEAMAPVLLFSDMGRSLTSCNAYIDGPTGPHRFAVRFYSRDGSHIATTALNINRCRFDWLDLEADEVIQTIPFGIDVHLTDFHELLLGGLQIWELATSRMRQWYLGTDKMRSPVAFLYGYFSEQVRPDIASQMYARIARECVAAPL